ncbi:hypothetical protein FGADI_4358 [Fusarium gaditjirri]|uniref:BTB domain-containing protein n=1 Tax=Fusarium gaditjirri TaxID=282569 RepID=A0A8H4TCW9_9HYPO|nr:hypothetical protein FGADI_4358 [Fusarium gaditjirri]
MAAQPHSVLLHLMQSGEFSDFSLICQDSEFKLHQMIVCPQSPVISAALRGGFEEATSKVITVNNFDVSTVQYMVTFLYTGDYKLTPEPEKKAPQQDHDDKREEGEIVSDDEKMSQYPREPQKVGDKTVYQIASHLRVNAIADYYNIDKLAKLSTGKINLILKKEVDFFIIPQIIAEMNTANRDSELRSLIASATARYIEELASSQVLRTIDLEHHLTIEILEACGQRIQQLMEDLSAAHKMKGHYKEAEHKQEQAKNVLLAKFRTVSQQLQNTPKCRNCKKDFGCYIEEPTLLFTEVSPYVLRCGGCGCRHP